MCSPPVDNEKCKTMKDHMMQVKRNRKQENWKVQTLCPTRPLRREDFPTFGCPKITIKQTIKHCTNFYHLAAHAFTWTNTANNGCEGKICKWRLADMTGISGKYYHHLPLLQSPLLPPSHPIQPNPKPMTLRKTAMPQRENTMRHLPRKKRFSWFCC